MRGKSDLVPLRPQPTPTAALQDDTMVQEDYFTYLLFLEKALLVAARSMSMLA